MKKFHNSVIILAAGSSSRLKSSVPKIFHEIGGLPMLNHVIKTAQCIGPSEIAVVLNPKHKSTALGENIKISYQNTPMGTADAVKCGLKVMHNNNDDEWVYILYGDIPLVSAETLLKLSKIPDEREKTGVVILAMDSSDTNDLGKLEPAEEPGSVKSIIEAKDASDFDKTIPLCNAGLFVKIGLLKSLINKIRPSESTGELYITEVVRLAYEAGYACRYYKGDTEELLGANTIAELASLEKKFQERERKKHMNNGVIMTAPDTVFFSHDTQIEDNVTIRPYVVFLGGVYIKSGTLIDSFCVLEGTAIDNATVGPFSRLRSGTEIQNGAKIGNFVEIKNSLVSEKTKINHLSYVGDALVGKNTNVGAGTITCNYDGFKKHKTIIGERVFIGSNTALVAPVEVASNALVGAGSVITKNVENGALAIARSRQRNIKNWSSNRVKKCAEL